MANARVAILFNKTCLNENILPIFTNIYIYIYIMYVLFKDTLLNGYWCTCIPNLLIKRRLLLDEPLGQWFPTFFQSRPLFDFPTMSATPIFFAKMSATPHFLSLHRNKALHKMYLNKYWAKMWTKHYKSDIKELIINVATEVSSALPVAR